MKTYRLIPSLLISALIWLTGFDNAQAQGHFPVENGQSADYSVFIQMPKAYISGICVLLNEDGVVKGSLFNDFGFTAMDFVFYPEKNKVKLVYVFDMMNKWYIRKVLKKDMAKVMNGLQNDVYEYVNAKRNITYKFLPKEDKTDDYETVE